MFCQITLFAQDPSIKSSEAAPAAFTVSEKVVDDQGNGLSGATVTQRGSSNATTTVAGRTFKITVQEDPAVLEISYVGFQAKEISVKDGTVDIIVQPSRMPSCCKSPVTNSLISHSA